MRRNCGSCRFLKLPCIVTCSDLVQGIFLIPEFTPPITEARVFELADQKILLDPRLRNEELLRWRKLIPNNGKQSGFSVTQVPLWILCLVLSISVVLRFFAKNSS